MHKVSFRMLCADEELDSQIKALRKILPPSMSLNQRSSTWYIDVESDTPEDVKMKYHVDRELDRLYFLSGTRIKAESCTSSVGVDLKGYFAVKSLVPIGIGPQRWDYSLGIQLRLWSLSKETEYSPVRLLLLYQIIELSDVVSATYLNSGEPPDPLTECRLLRNLVTHAGDVGGEELKRYCEYLGMPALMFDVTDESYLALVSSKCQFVEDQARQLNRKKMEY